MTKRELKKNLNDKNIELICVDDWSFGYGRPSQVGIVNEKERTLLVNMFNYDSEGFQRKEESFIYDSKEYRFN